MNAIAILMGVAGIMFILLKDVFLGYEMSSPVMTLAVSATFVMVSVSIFLLNYLKSGQVFGEKRNVNEDLMREELSVLRKELKNSSNFNRHSERLFEEVQLLKEKILNNDRKDELLSEEEKYEIVSNLKKEILKNASESFLAEIEKSIPQRSERPNIYQTFESNVSK